MFKLLRYFSITSLVSIVAAAIVLGFVYRQLAIAGLMKVAEAKNTAVARVLANSSWLAFSPLLATEGLSGDELRAHPAVAGSRRDVDRYVRGVPVLKVKIFNLAGQTVFSTEASQIGEDRSASPGFLAASEGKVVSELRSHNSFRAIDRDIENRDLLSTSIPARRSAEGPIEGVLEIYSDVTPFTADVKRAQLAVTLSVVFVLTLIYGSLFLIVRHADRILKRGAMEQREIARLASFPQENPNPLMELNSNGTLTYLNPSARTHFPEMETDGVRHPILEGLVEMIRDTDESFVIREINMAGQIYEQHINIKGDVMKIRMTDVTERRRMQQVLAESEARLSTLMNLAPVGIFTTDAKGECTYVNNRWCQLTGYSQEQARGQGWVQALHPEDKEAVFNKWHNTVKTGSEFAHEYRFLSPSGRVTWVSGSAIALVDGAGAIGGYIGIAMDITERMRAEERLDYLAHHDSLTGLPNRVLLHDRLRQTMIDAERHGRLVAVLFFDLDRFKTINDTLGHEVGNALLKSVAERLQQCVRGGDTVARLGGDEFTVVLADVAHVDDVARVAHKILRNVAMPFQIGGKELFITTSMGITLFPSDDDTLEGLLKNADVAMYQAKEAGRNVFRYFTAEMNTRALERMRLETELRHALKRNEFLLLYQPQINLKNSRVIGVEALIRWHHPKFGLIPPVQFIPIAEETGLIGPIGEWVMQTACAQNKAWQKQGLCPVCVSVNVSAWQLRQQELVGSIAGILKKTGLAPKYLSLELTESMLIDNVEQTVAMLSELHALGIGFSVDDFGTGYSSLSYLKRFPLDVLKIDRSFIHGIPGNTEDAAIARAIIVMAHGLGIKTTAEGVETREQLAFLQAHQCDAMQGYYFSPPVPAEAIAEFLREQVPQATL